MITCSKSFAKRIDCSIDGTLRFSVKIWNKTISHGRKGSFLLSFCLLSINCEFRQFQRGGLDGCSGAQKGMKSAWREKEEGEIRKRIKFAAKKSIDLISRQERKLLLRYREGKVWKLFWNLNRKKRKSRLMAEWQVGFRALSCFNFVLCFSILINYTAIITSKMNFYVFYKLKHSHTWALFHQVFFVSLTQHLFRA